jgi:NodT family efflux transporter outer membrane factor (OMF) lipoprotein
MPARARRLGRILACLVLLTVLPSCGIPPLRPAEPGPGLPETYNGRTSEDSSSRFGIDEFYSDPRLLDLIHQALANNRELKILNEEVVIASNEVLSRSGAYLPFLTAGPIAGIDRASNRAIEGAAIREDEFAPGRSFSNPHGYYWAGATLRWQIDIYRQLRNARDAAGQRYTEAIERRDFFMTCLVADVAENYYRLLGLDERIANLNQIIQYLEQGLEIARARKEFAVDNELGVLRFQAEVQRNQSEKLVIDQQIVETENRINFLVNRYPQQVNRSTAGFFDLYIQTLDLGVPSQLLQNRRDIRQAERELTAAGLDVKVARADFYPQLVLDGNVALQAYNMSYLFMPQAVMGNFAGSLIGPLINRRAIKAEYLTNSARQRQAIYDYQRTVLNAFTEVMNRMTMVQNYSSSIVYRKQELTSLASAVEVATTLFQRARAEYLDVLTAQRELRDARMALIDTKVEQLNGMVRVYQALGGGTQINGTEGGGVGIGIPYTHTVEAGENFWTIAERFYQSGRFYKALWAANRGTIPAIDQLKVGDSLTIPPIDQLDPAQVDKKAVPPDPMLPAATPVEDAKPDTASDATALPPALPPAVPDNQPGPFNPTAPPPLPPVPGINDNPPTAPADPPPPGG